MTMVMVNHQALLLVFADDSDTVVRFSGSEEEAIAFYGQCNQRLPPGNHDAKVKELHFIGTGNSFVYEDEKSTHAGGVRS